MPGFGPPTGAHRLAPVVALTAVTTLGGYGCAPKGDRPVPQASPVSTTAQAEAPRLPASFDPTRDITDLTPLTRGLRLARPVDGVRHGELVLTIRNNGPAPVRRLMFTVEVPESMSADGGDWAGCTPLVSAKPGYPAGAKCDKGYLAAGRSRSFRLGMRSPAHADGSDSRVSRWLTDVWSAGEWGEQLNDRAPEDNRKIFSVYRD